MISASALSRLFRCPGSEALPKANTTSAWAEQGTDRHAEQEERIEAGDVPEDIRRLVGEDVLVRAEVALAYDVATDTGRELGQGTDRAYQSLGPSEIPGTADVLAVVTDAVVIADAKGWEDVEPADRNVQIACLALAAARTYDRDEAIVAIIYLRGERRFMDHARLDAFEIDAFAARLRDLVQRVARQKDRVASGHMPDVSEGPWCRYCPAMHACPAKVTLLRRLVSGQETDEIELMRPLSVETARLAYDRLKAARGLLKRIEAALYAFAAETPIPLDDGRFFGKHEKLGNEKLNGDTVHAVVAEKFGAAVALDAVVLSATKKRLGEALKKAGVPVIAAAERNVLAEVRARGGATREKTTTIEEFEPQRALEKESA